MVLFFKCNSREDLERCALLIDNGSIVIFPTDTVYGIGCDPFNESSVLNLYKIKNRPLEKRLPILTNSVSNLSDLVEITDEAKKLISHFWPGPLTLILNVKRNKIMQNRYAFGKTMAIRIPNNTCALNLIQMTKKKLLVGTSANLSQKPHFSHIHEISKTGLQGYDAIIVKEDESQSIDYLKSNLNLPATVATSKAGSITTTKKTENDVVHSISDYYNPTRFVSTIVDLTDTDYSTNNRPKIIREGAISKEKIFSLLGQT